MALLHKELWVYCSGFRQYYNVCITTNGNRMPRSRSFYCYAWILHFTRLDRNKTHLLFGDRWDANFLLHCKFASVQYTDLSKIHIHIVQKSRSYLCLFTRLINFYLFARTKSHRYPRCKLYWIKKLSNFIWKKKEFFR